MTEYTMPAAVDAERYVLGAVLLSAAALDDVVDIIDPRDMFEPRHEAIYAAARRLHEQGSPTDPVALEVELSRHGDLTGNLDISYLFDLTSAVPTASGAAYWAEIVKERAVRRRLMAASQEVARLATDESVDAVDAVELARERVDSVGIATSLHAEPIGTGFWSFFQNLAEKPKAIETPWFDLNQIIGGLRPGGLVVVGARPAQGKSLVALQLAMGLAKHGTVAYVSLEMSADEIRARMIAQVAQVSLGGLINHSVPAADWEKIRVHREAVERTPIHVATSDQVSTITQVRSFARTVARRAPKDKPLTGIVVDYLQLLGSSERVESRQQEVAKFSRSLKLLAQQMGVPVIALSQLNRGSAMRRGNRPTLTDLRESGAIEQDADVVMLLHRDEKNKPNDLGIEVAKNRQGQNGRLTLQWQGQFARAMGRAWTPTRLLDDAI